LYAYYPKDLPDLEVYYHIHPGQGETFDDPGYEPEVEWEDIEIGGLPISVELHHHFVSQFGKRWEAEIINTLKTKSKPKGMRPAA
jgi:hypothetical protein